MDPEARWREAPDEGPPHEVDWPADAVSAVVIGVSTPSAGRSSTGTTARAPRATASSSASSGSSPAWLEKDLSVTTYRPPYFIESGGIVLKDSAVMAGLGCVGKNNLVVTP